MEGINLDQTLQYLAYILALSELIIGLYVWVLNIQHTANRHVGGLMLVIAANSFAIGTLLETGSARQAEWPAILLAATTPAIQPLLLLTTVSLLRPAWLQTSRLRWALRLAYLLTLLPIIITAIDVQFGAGLWYSGMGSSPYGDGILRLESFTAGRLNEIIRLLTFGISSTLTILVCLYIAALDRKSPKMARGLAWLLLAADIAAGVSLVALASVIPQAIAELLTSAIFMLVYAFVAFRQMVSERRVQRGRLQVRLLALNLVVVVPVLLGLTYFIISQSRRLLEEDASRNLQQTSQNLASSTMLWLESNTRTLAALANQPDIRSMDASRQIPALQAFASVFPEIYLVSTTDLTGRNIARSDGQSAVDYSRRSWFQQAVQGAPLALETLIEPSSGQPVLVASAPIRDEQGRVAGVIMFATQLSVISEKVAATSIGRLGYAYVINESNLVIAHPEEAFTMVLRDLSQHPAVQAVRRGLNSPVTFGSAGGMQWKAFGQVLPNGWAVIVQAPQNELQSSLGAFQRTSWIALGVASGLLLLLSYISVRQSFEPLSALTRAAQAIGSGDLQARAPVLTDDEVGALAQTLNKTTSQLGELVANLETRVADRTQALERRAIQLQVAADVAREAAGIRQLDELLNHVVHQISERFGFYHAGIFLCDQVHEYAVLQAASSEGGRRMLERGHKLKIGQVGIVGYVTGSGAARIALDVGADAVFFNNPDLPQTRSEMALPLKAGNQVIGALDVQSTLPSAFKEEDIAILQILADQLALAIQNARLMEESRQSMQELEKRYRNDVQQSWAARLSHRPLRYRYERMGVYPVTAVDSGKPGNGNGRAGAPGSNQPESFQPEDGRTLRIPLQFRGAKIGALLLRREMDQPAWSEKEAAVAQFAARQIALALENARLLESTVLTAEREHQVAEITHKMLSANGIDAVLRTAMQELSRYLSVTQGMIQLERVGNNE